MEEEKRLLTELDPKIDIPYRPPYEYRPAKENKARQDNYDLTMLLLDTGGRYEEIAGLAWDRVNLDDRSINLWRAKVKNESIYLYDQ